MLGKNTHWNRNEIWRYNDKLISKFIHMLNGVHFPRIFRFTFSQPNNNNNDKNQKMNMNLQREKKNYRTKIQTYKNAIEVVAIKIC